MKQSFAIFYMFQISTSVRLARDNHSNSKVKLQQIETVHLFLLHEYIEMHGRTLFFFYERN